MTFSIEKKKMSENSLKKMMKDHSLCSIGIALRIGSCALKSESFCFVEIDFGSFHLAILAKPLLFDGRELLNSIRQAIGC